MDSARLPGKVLREVLGMPMLGHLIDRLEHCDGLTGICIATSSNSTDDALADYAAGRGLPCIRGSLDDVAGRLVDGAARQGIEHMVRISGDSPMLDPAIVARAIGIYRRERPDLVTNVQQRTYPKGQSVEVFSRQLLTEAWTGGMSAADREHVTPYFYRNAGRFSIRNFTFRENRGGVQLSVDTEADLIRFEGIISRLGAPYWQHGLESLLAAFDSMTIADDRNP